MERISAADNLLIDTTNDRWRILVNTNFVDNVPGDGLLFESANNQQIRYTTVFASTHRLPKNGVLPVRYVERVVLGWSQADEAWHLGLILADQLAAARGSRWCELARWPDPDRALFAELSMEVGQRLARVIERPFNVIPIKREQVVTQAPPPKPLPALPLDMRDWYMQQQENGWFAFIREGGWARERQRRIGWYAFWAVVYVVLSIATILSDIALPRPELLPYAGLATALLLVGIVIYTIWELSQKPRRIVIDPETQQIWGVPREQGGKPVWRKGRNDIDSVYVSEVIKHNKDNAQIQYGEINLRLTDGSFYFLVSQTEPTPLYTESSPDDDQINPLESGQVKTDMQAASLYLAQALDVPVWYDYRKA